MAAQDSIDAVLPFAVNSGLHQSQAVALPLLLFAGLGLYRACRKDRGGLDVSLALLAAFFFWLALGPAGGLYSGLYGVSVVLERFWWPYRHVVVFCVCIALLACRALPAAGRKAPWWALALALSTPLSLTLQGDRIKPAQSPVNVPPPIYPELATLPGDVILQPPFTAAAAASQAPLIYQLYHQKKMINGHAPWVNRVRPTAWDQMIEENSFLSALARLEQGNLASFSFEATDLQTLLDEGLAWVVLDRELFSNRVLDLRKSYRAILEDLFGEPRLHASGIRVYETAKWEGVHDLDTPLWTLPDGENLALPNRPLEGLRPRSPMFDP